MKKWMTGLWAAMFVAGLISKGEAAIPAPKPEKPDTSAELIVNLLLKKGVITQQEAADLLGQVEEAQQKAEGKLNKIPEKGVVVSANTGTKMVISGYTQVQGRFGDAVIRSPSDTAEIRRARIGLDGSLTKQVDYLLLLDMVGIKNNGVLKDAKLTYKAFDWANFNAGQYKVPFSLEGNASDARMETIERSKIVDATFPERQVGATLSGKLWDGFFAYDGGAFNGNGPNTTNDNGSFLYIGHVILTPYKGQLMDQDVKVQAGGGIGTSRDRNVDLSSLGFKQFKGDRDLFELDGTVEFGKLTVNGEYDRANLDFAGLPGSPANPTKFIAAVPAQPARSGDADGFHITASYFVFPRWQFVTKYETFTSQVVPDFSAITLGLNYYFTEPDPKALPTRLMADYLHAFEGDQKNQVVLQFQVGY